VARPLKSKLPSRCHYRGGTPASTPRSPPWPPSAFAPVTPASDWGVPGTALSGRCRSSGSRPRRHASNAGTPARRRPGRASRRAHGPRRRNWDQLRRRVGGRALDATDDVSPGSNTSGQGNGCVPKLIMTGERRQIATEPSCMAASWLSESAFTTEPCCIRIVLVSLSARAAAAAASFDAPAGPDTAAP